MMLHWYDPVVDPVADLHSAERTDWSQHGEDGLLEALIDRVGAPGRIFVEIGASDGEENCTRSLAERGWRGFWFEADTERVAEAEKVAAELDIVVRQAYVKSGTVVELLTTENVPRDVDVAVVDIDGNDYWVLRELLGSFSPRIVVVEYNAAFPPEVFWVRRNRPDSVWDNTYRHGASLAAFAWLADNAGYRLVACDSAGANAFFVRDDLADAVGPPVPIDQLYRPLLVAPPAVGHPWRTEPDCPQLSGTEIDALRVVSAALVRRRPLDGSGTGQLVSIIAEVANGTSHRLTSAGPTPVRLSAHLVDGYGDIVEYDAERHWIHGGIPRRARAWAGGVFAIRSTRVTTVRLCLVQESVGWAEAGGFDVDVSEPDNAEVQARPKSSS